MDRYLVAYAGALVVLLALDFIWLGLAMRRFYRTALGDLAKERPNVAAAAAFYCLYVVGITIFAISPAIDTEQWLRALTLGGLFGFFAYMTYDLVNFATLKRYPFRLAIMDIGWGVAVTGAAAAAGYFAAALYGR